MSPTCFGRKIRPSSGAIFDCIYSFWYNAPTLLLTGATVEMGCIVPKAVYTVKKSAPEDGRICRQKYVGLN